MLYGGGLDQLWRQAVGIGAVLVYSLACTTVIAYALKFTIGLRIDQGDRDGRDRRISAR